EDHRGGPGGARGALADQSAQRGAGLEQMLLAHHLVEGARAHPDRQRAAGRILLLAFFGCGGEQVGLHDKNPKSPHRHPGRGRQPVQKSHQRVRISMPITPMCSTGMTQVNSPKKLFSQEGAGRKPLRTLKEVTYQNMMIVATQARQHHRHRALIRYRDWNISQAQKATPKRVPALKVSQYQRGKRAPASRLMPTQITMPEDAK